MTTTTKYQEQSAEVVLSSLEASARAKAEHAFAHWRQYFGWASETVCQGVEDTSWGLRAVTVIARLAGLEYVYGQDSYLAGTPIDRELALELLASQVGVKA